jgi:predicted nucleic acid-binding protein
VAFFNRKPSVEKAASLELTRANRVALIGPVLTEILRGFRRDAEADWAASALEGVYFIELRWEDWKSAAALGRRLAAVGRNLPLTDLILASVALSQDYAVYSTDPHFDLIPDLLRFKPDEGN